MLGGGGSNRTNVGLKRVVWGNKCGDLACSNRTNVGLKTKSYLCTMHSLAAQIGPIWNWNGIKTENFNETALIGHTKGEQESFLSSFFNPAWMNVEDVFSGEYDEYDYYEDEYEEDKYNDDEYDEEEYEEDEYEEEWDEDEGYDYDEDDEYDEDGF